MAKVRVAVLGTVGKSVSFDPEATKGAVIGTNLYLPDGKTLATFDDLLGRGSGSTQQHSSLQGLQVGDDHPQYTMWAAKESIKATWSFKRPQNIVRTDLASVQWSYLRWTDESAAAAPPIRMAHDDFGSFHMSANADYAFSGNLFNRDNTAKPSMMISMNFQFQEIMFHIGAAGAGQLNWNQAGAAVRINTSGQLITTSSGTAAAPAITVGGLLNMGIWRTGNTMRFSTAGVEQFNVSSTAFDVSPNLYASGGSASSPSLGFWPDAGRDTGWYLSSANTIGMTLGGTSRATYSTTSFTYTVVQQGPSGAATGPTWSTSGDPNTGNYSTGADAWGTATGGVLRLEVTTSAIISTLPFRGPNGTAGAPAYSFSGSTTDGLALTGTHQLALVTNGTAHVEIGSAGEVIIGGDAGSVGEVLTSGGSGAPPTWSAGGGSGAPASLTYITEADETADLPNSLQLIAGTGITFDTTTPNQLEISSSGGGGTAADIQFFSASGTWTKPSGSPKITEVICIGGGGGGGSGRKGATATTRWGGSGGGGGGLSKMTFNTSVLGGTETVTVGTGGTGGAAQATNSTNGNNGNAGNATTFGNWLRANGGSGGLGGTSGTASAGGVAGSGLLSAGGTGGLSGSSAPATVTPSNYAGAGGGGGGSVSNANVQFAGDNGAASPVFASSAVAGGTGGAAGTNNGGNGNAMGQGLPGTGGGGGGANVATGNGGNGGNGSVGSGGGGGGGATNGVGNSGTGGTGGDGIVLVITYF